MTDLNDWANLAADNDRTQVPDYLPEGASPVPAFNNWSREAQAAVRRFYETLEWRNFLDDSETPSFTSSTTFDVPAGKASLFSQDQRVRITDTGFAVNPGYGTITGVAGQAITVKMDDTGNNITAAISLVECGFNPDGNPITVDFIKDFASQVVAVASGNEDYMRRVDGSAIAATFATATTCTIPAANRYDVWLEARINITDPGMPGGGGTGYISGITFGTDPETDPATVTIVEDDAESLTATMTTIEVITPTKNDAMVMDSRGQARGAGVPLATVDVDPQTFTIPATSSSTAHSRTGWDFFSAVLVSKGTGGFATDEEIPVPIMAWANQNKGTPNIGFSVSVDSTDVNIYILDTDSSGNPPAVISPSGTVVDINSTNFDLKVTFFEFAQVVIP
ncbi:MAG: hypothetical protein PVI97_00715 [Candidatus Thiodiazotropha sp.]|jgi:hypothetical protein